MKIAKILILAIISFLAINSFSGDLAAKPRVKVRVGPHRVVMVTKVKTRTCHRWINGHYRRNRYGRLIWVQGHWSRK